jgi:regulator of RNase E activity RraB
LRQFAAYKYDYNSQEDPSWDQYLNVLYPSPEQLERIGNQDLLDHLLTQGDNPLIEREIRHWIYFPSAELRDAFKQALDSPFEVDHEYDEDNGNPFALVVKRIQSLQQPQIDDTVIELFRLAEQFQGNYTGWETPVTTE